MKVNLLKLFWQGYVLNNFLPGFSKTNSVNLPSAAIANILKCEHSYPSTSSIIGLVKNF